MALTIEDGSLVEDANSYATVAEVRAFAAARASAVPAAGEDGDASIEAALIVANDFLESRREEFRGVKVDGEQALQWPRSGVTIDGFEIDDDAIPKNLKNAQCQLALEIAAGLDIMPTGDGREVIREKIDVLETEWKSGGAAQPVLVKVRAFLAPLLKSGSGGLTVYRI